MSRHRNVRNLDLDEEYDEAYDDTVYGRSVDDCDYGVSPTAAQYLYSHARGNLGAYLSTSTNIQEEENFDQYIEEQDTYQKPQLSDEDEARLQSILDQLRNILGDTVGECEMTAAVIERNFSVEGALDNLLNRDKLQAKGTVTDDGRAVGDVAAVAQAARPPPTQKKNNGKQQKNADGGNGSQQKQVVKVSTPSNRVVRGFDVTPSGSSKKSNHLNVEEGSSSNKLTPSTTPARPVRLPTKQRDAILDISSLYSSLHGAEGGGEGKQLLSLVIVGHVDAGKSTLTGHLLYKQGHVSKRVMHKYEQESKKTGKQTMYAWVTDDTEEERSRGITVDVAERSFETATKIVNVLDAPGHRDFIPNMISGAARADVALLVVDANTGEFEAGFESHGQTREHAMLIKSLGVSQVAVAINKLDTVQWSEQRYSAIRSALAPFLRSVGYRPADVQYVPCSGLTGENLVEKSKEKRLTEWYNGPTVLEIIDGMQPPQREVLRPTRFSISDVYRGGSNSVCVAGKLHTGYIRPADRLLLAPFTQSLTVKDVVSSSGSSGQLFAGDSGTVTVQGAADPDTVTVGSFLCDPANPMRQVTRLRARVVVFAVTMPIIRGTQMEFHHQALCQPATVRRLVAQIDKSTGEVIKKSPRVLPKQTAGVLELQLARPVCLETYTDSRELGRFMLRQQGTTMAAGLVTEILDCKSPTAYCSEGVSSVDTEEGAVGGTQ